MQAPFTLNIYREDLTQIVQSVFRTMMDMDAEPMITPWRPPPAAITSAVHFAGEWRGATLVECDAQTARQFARHFMGIPLPDTIDDDVRDVMGELANMVAGNMKSLLPRGVNLSMPSVVEGSDYSMRVCGGSLTEQAPFTSPAGNFCVTLIELLHQS